MANIKQNRFLSIAKTKEEIFHINDLARIWQISNGQTLSITLNRYIKAGLLYRIHRGLYSLKEVNELDPVYLGVKIINSYCYLSTETILAKHGLIFQKLNYFTFIGLKSKRFKIGNNHYYCRQLKKDYLYNDIGVIKNKQFFNQASLERAVADILYFNPSYHFDNISNVNKAKFKNIQLNVYNKLNYDHLNS